MLLLKIEHGITSGVHSTPTLALALYILPLQWRSARTTMTSRTTTECAVDISPTQIRTASQNSVLVSALHLWESPGQGEPRELEPVSPRLGWCYSCCSTGRIHSRQCNFGTKRVMDFLFVPCAPSVNMWYRYTAFIRIYGMVNRHAQLKTYILCTHSQWKSTPSRGPGYSRCDITHSLAHTKLVYCFLSPTLLRVGDKWVSTTTLHCTTLIMRCDIIVAYIAYYATKD